MGLRINEHGKIIFRHPLVIKGKYGKVICVAVGKQSGERQGKVKDGLARLLELKPALPDECKGEKIDKMALDAWFEPMKAKEETGDELWGLAPETPEEKQRRHDKNLAEGLKQGNLDGRQMHGLLIEAQQKNAEQEATIIALRKHIGARSETEKRLTLWECLTHAWFFLPTRAGTRNTGRLTVLRRAGAVLDAIGLDRPFASVTQDDIINAVEATIAKDQDFERYARKQAVKRVIDFLCRPEIKDGLGFAQNPAEDIIVGSIGALQRKKRQKGEIKTLDPMPFLDKLQPYEKALASCVAFAGLRLAEAAGLTWDAIDFKEGLIRIRASDHYPELKSINSYRDVRPFDDIWEPLKALQKLKLNPILLFPRQYPPSEIKRKRTRETWFDLHNDDVKVIELSGYFRERMEEQTGLTFEEPARRMRRFWETTMKAKGLGHYLLAMSGHDSKTGDAHYTEYEPIVRASKGQIGRIR